MIALVAAGIDILGRGEKGMVPSFNDSYHSRGVGIFILVTTIKGGNHPLLSLAETKRGWFPPLMLVTNIKIQHLLNGNTSFSITALRMAMIFYNETLHRELLDNFFWFSYIDYEAELE
jgi:hypothetical protein